ncbi:MAG TPA: hypothetical protein VKT12_03700, partial [Candidatus Binataceae bacterium]|nr:hypothetical protein [Candidatus Binataceae bacterium]
AAEAEPPRQAPISSSVNAAAQNFTRILSSPSCGPGFPPSKAVNARVRVTESGFLRQPFAPFSTPARLLGVCRLANGLASQAI